MILFTWRSNYPLALVGFQLTSCGWCWFTTSIGRPMHRSLTCCCMLESFLQRVLEYGNEPVVDMPLLADVELQSLKTGWESDQEPIPEIPIHEIIAGHVQQTPDNVAVCCGDRQLTYRELDEQANQLACNIEVSEPGQPVALFVERSVEMIVGILGILKPAARMCRSIRLTRANA